MLANADPIMPEMFLDDVAELPGKITAGVTITGQQHQPSNTGKYGVDFVLDLDLADPWLSMWNEPVLSQSSCHISGMDNLQQWGTRLWLKHKRMSYLVGHAFTSLRAGNPQKDPQTRQLDFQLAQQQADYKTMDIPSRHELPIPKDAIKQVQQLNMMAGMAKDKAVRDLIPMAFFCWTNTDGRHPFL
jgi:hypothetical protein